MKFNCKLLVIIALSLVAINQAASLFRSKSKKNHNSSSSRKVAALPTSKFNYMEKEINKPIITPVSKPQPGGKKNEDEKGNFSKKCLMESVWINNFTLESICKDEDGAPEKKSLDLNRCYNFKKAEGGDSKEGKIYMAEDDFENKFASKISNSCIDCQVWIQEYVAPYTEEYKVDRNGVMNKEKNVVPSVTKRPILDCLCGERKDSRMLYTNQKFLEAFTGKRTSINLDDNINYKDGELKCFSFEHKPLPYTTTFVKETKYYSPNRAIKMQTQKVA